MDEPKKYYVSTGFGCAIVTASSKGQARSKVLREVGRQGMPIDVREATEEDLEWSEAMGGKVW